jgi:hypothetical protein
MRNIQPRYLFDFTSFVIDKDFNIVIFQLIEIDFITVVADGNNKCPSLEERAYFVLQGCLMKSKPGSHTSC